MVNCITQRKFGRLRVTRNFLEALGDNDLKNLFEMLGFVFKSDESLTDETYNWIFANPSRSAVEIESQIPEYTLSAVIDAWGRRKLNLLLNGIIVI